MGDVFKNERLVDNRFLQAFGKKQPPAGLILHTEHGSQYTSSKFQT